MQFYEVKTTFESLTDAQNMAEALLDKKLVACGQIFEIESHYAWQGKREVTKEFLLVMKTRKGLLKILESEIAKMHSYDLPEIVTTKIHCTKEYGAWIENSTKGEGHDN